jgi:4-amino-4-deoxy-L-arabinose transferase-like glycosyltransferase
LSRTWLLLPLLLLYLYNLGGAGFGLDPDEPRYAAIGREMAHSGDWVTPHLNGSPWYEKPPLLYWMTAAATKLRLRDEWAARLPVALLSLAFLAFFYTIVEREFSGRTAMMATALLGTSAGWIGYSFVAVTDLPVAVTFNAAMLLALFDTRPRRGRPGGKLPVTAGWIAGALLGLAILAKAFLPAALFIPVWLVARGKRLAIIAGAFLVAAPWHILMSLRHGHAFWDVYFWQQQVGRFNSAALQHGEPFWFYLAVLPMGLFPWTPLFALLARKKTYADVRVSSLAIWIGLALVFLSAFANKLPGYLLSLLPAMAIVLAIALEKAPAQEWWIAGCVLLLALAPSIAGVLPDALLAGFTHARWPLRLGGLPFAFLAAAGTWWLAWRKQPALALLAGALAAAIAAAYLKTEVLPVLDRRVAVRSFYRAHEPEMADVCLDGSVRPKQEYALEYYAGRKVPGCAVQPAKFQVTSNQEGLAPVSKTP